MAAANRAKFVVAGAVLAAAMLFLVTRAFTENALTYYLTVAEYVSEPDREGSFRVSGLVYPDSIERSQLGLELSFVMMDADSDQHLLPVYYQGEIPDTFTAESEVVVEGELGADGTFQARTLFAKCPSKYEGVDGEPYGEAGKPYGGEAGKPYGEAGTAGDGYASEPSPTI